MLRRIQIVLSSELMIPTLADSDLCFVRVQQLPCYVVLSGAA